VLSSFCVHPAVAQSLRGTVLDSTAAPVAGAHVTVIASGATLSIRTDDHGEFALSMRSGPIVVKVAADGFAERVERFDESVVPPDAIVIVLELAAIQETVTVTGSQNDVARMVTSATRTPTPLRDIPQAISVVTSTLIADQRMQSIADVVRYMPGVGIAQGEGNRDTPVLRGNSTTADFFVDGIRDDVQYFRDLYNVDRVEALKGSNAMIFGRGGVGGVINRVTRQADFSHTREVGLQFGSWDNRRLTADLGGAFGHAVALRVTGIFEDSGSYRDDVQLKRSGVNPTAAFVLGARTILRAGYEHFSDRRTADRGIPSDRGRPVATAASAFFGDPRLSRSQATVDVATSMIEHHFGPRVTIRNRVSYGQFDKFYQNVYPGVVNPERLVSISAYNHTTARENLFDQLDLVIQTRTGRFGHTLLLGSEYGRQTTDNLRNTGYFSNNSTSLLVPLSQPTISTAVDFRNNPTDASNHSVASTTAIYAQDQVALSTRVQAVVGLRAEHLTVGLRDTRTGGQLESRDRLLSPRLGFIVKPVAPASIYASYGLSYQPRAGEQLASLSATNQALQPEEFRTFEVGAKWAMTPSLDATAAVYRLDRGNVVVPDALDPTRVVLVDAQRTRGVELGFAGTVIGSWALTGGYAFQTGQITRSISVSARAGAQLAQLPKHSFSLWNRYEVSNQLALGVGMVYRGSVFTSTDNAVVLPPFVRFDGAVFYRFGEKLRLQANVENALDHRYYASAHNNTNITPGSPRALRVAVTTRF
jgi:catecholate siderophore receptor